ncbi:unnamed protein product [Sphacelaria rigidula]
MRARQKYKRERLATRRQDFLTEKEYTLVEDDEARTGVAGVATAVPGTGQGGRESSTTRGWKILADITLRATDDVGRVGCGVSLHPPRFNLRYLPPYAGPLSSVPRLTAGVKSRREEPTSQTRTPTKDGRVSKALILPTPHAGRQRNRSSKADELPATLHADLCMADALQAHASRERQDESANRALVPPKWDGPRGFVGGRRPASAGRPLGGEKTLVHPRLPSVGRKKITTPTFILPNVEQESID